VPSGTGSAAETGAEDLGGDASCVSEREIFAPQQVTPHKGYKIIWPGITRPSESENGAVSEVKLIKVHEEDKENGGACRQAFSPVPPLLRHVAADGVIQTSPTPARRRTIDGSPAMQRPVPGDGSPPILRRRVSVDGSPVAVLRRGDGSPVVARQVIVDSSVATLTSRTPSRVYTPAVRWSPPPGSPVNGVRSPVTRRPSLSPQRSLSPQQRTRAASPVPQRQQSVQVITQVTPVAAASATGPVPASTRLQARVCQVAPLRARAGQAVVAMTAAPPAALPLAAVAGSPAKAARVVPAPAFGTPTKTVAVGQSPSPARMSVSVIARASSADAGRLQTPVRQRTPSAQRALPTVGLTEPAQGSLQSPRCSFTPRALRTPGRTVWVGASAPVVAPAVAPVAGPAVPRQGTPRLVRRSSWTSSPERGRGVSVEAKAPVPPDAKVVAR